MQREPDLEEGALPQVTLRLSVAVLEAVSAQLQALLDANPGTALAKKVEKALEKVEQALEEFNKTPPDNQEAVNHLKTAVSKLETAVEKGLLSEPEGTSLMDPLAGSARVVATEAIAVAIAQNGKAQKIAKAQQALADGDTHRAAGEFKKAVREYKRAVTKAEGALTGNNDED